MIGAYNICTVYLIEVEERSRTTETLYISTVFQRCGMGLARINMKPQITGRP